MLGRASSSALLPLAVVLALGCPRDGTSPQDGTTSSSSSSSSSTDGTTAEVTSDSTDSYTSADSTSSGSTDSCLNPDPTSSESTGPPTPIPTLCESAICSSAEYCLWLVGACGLGTFNMGTCLPRPESCPAECSPVCGCDDLVYDNECSANAAGVDITPNGACETPEGYFRCGYNFCAVGIEYCEIIPSDIGKPSSYFCVQPTTPCDPLDCSCLQGEPCFGDYCEMTEDGNVEIVCSVP